MSDLSHDDRVASTLLDLHEALCRERDEAHRHLSRIEGELARLKTAAAALGLDLPELEFVRLHEGLQHTDQSARSGKSTETPRTIKEAALSILKDHGVGMSTLEILPYVNDILGTSYERGSLSPQLSRLLKDKKIYRDGDKWICLGISPEGQNLNQ